MKKNEIERTARLEPEVYVKVKFIMNSMVCGQPDPQCKQWGESTSEQTVEAMQENHQRCGRFALLQDPWSPMCGIHCLAFLERFAHRKTFELCNNSYKMNDIIALNTVMPYIKKVFCV